VTSNQNGDNEIVVGEFILCVGADKDFYFHDKVVSNVILLMHIL